MTFLGGLLILGGVLLALHWAANAPPKNVLKGGLMGLAIILGLVLLFLVVTGRIGFLWAALLAILPWINRLRMARGAYNFFKNMRGPSPGGNSEIKTRFLAMSLDHDSGALDGVVREGPYQGHRLSEMAQSELVDLAKQTAAEDTDSLRLLETYMDRRFGSEWRDGMEGSEERRDTSSAGGGPMSREEALSLLGLGSDASDQDIKAAHRRLMKTAHPDHGGSDYLASKINQAKDVLLG